jgi:hypothetical protein
MLAHPVLLALLLAAASNNKAKKSEKAQPPPPPAAEAPRAAPAVAKPAGAQLGIYRLVPPGTADDPAMKSIEETFRDVAQASNRYANVVPLATPPKLCDLEDDNCFAMVGGFQQLDQVLVGEVLKLQNGAAVKVRLVDVAKGKAVGQKNLTLQTDDNAEIKSWAEALACDLLHNTTCKGQAMIDVDLPDMRVIIDNLQYPRTNRNPETYTLPLGVHTVRVMVDQRTSVERKVLVSRDVSGKPALYARQLSQGGISLLRPQDLTAQKSELSASVRTTDLKQTKWTRPVGYTVAAVGLLAIGGAVLEGLHSRSLSNDASAQFQANGGGYLQSNLSTIDSARSAASTANILFVVGGVLAATGATMAFAF